MNVHELMDKDCFVLFVGLMDTNPTDFQKQVFGGLGPPVGVLKFWMLEVGSKSFASQEEAKTWGFLPDYIALCWGWGLQLECISAFLTVSVGIFSFSQCEEIIPLVSVSFRGIGSAYSCILSVSVAGGVLRRLLYFHLVSYPKLQFTNLKCDIWST